MRAAILLVALLAGVPAAAGQVGGEVTVSIEEPNAPILPLAERASLNVTIDVVCPLLAQDAGRPSLVRVHLLEAPAWARVTLSPAEHVVPPTSECAGTTHRLVSKLDATTSAEAPAFEPTRVRVGAALVDLRGNHSGEATVLIEADYFPVLDVSVPEPIRIARPGERLAFAVTVTSLANAPTRVEFAVVGEPTGGLLVERPDPIVLPPRGANGGSSTTLSVDVVAPEGSLLTNQPSLATLVARATDALSRSAEAAEIQFSLLVTAKGTSSLPAPGFLAALALMAIFARVLQAPRRR